MTTDFRPTSTPEWQPDILGFPFTQTTLDLGIDPDGEGNITATLVRKDPVEPSAPAVVWVHGHSDYFFHRHVADFVTAAGYAFYAIDLRKCGRSIRPGQSPHHISNLELYDEELTRMLDILHEAGHPSISFIAHSTGGLIVPLWLDRLRRCDDRRHAWVSAAVLNSPWLDLHTTGWRGRVAKLAATPMSKVFPSRALPVSSEGGYGKSLHKDHCGEWDFNTEWKPLSGQPKNWQWLHAILSAQRTIDSGIDVGVPTLVLHSDQSILDQPYSPALDVADAVLDVEQIAAQAHKLGSRVQRTVIPGSRHDVFLSRNHALVHAQKITEEFLAVTIGNHD